MKYQPKGQFLAGLSTLAIMIAALYGGAAAIATVTPDPNKQTAAIEKVLYPEELFLSQGQIIGKAAVVYDITQRRVLFQKNATDPLPLASLTKLITAHAALAQHSGDTPVTVTHDDLKLYADGGLRVGDKLTLSQLIKLGLVISSNSAMAAVANSLGSTSIDTINAHAGQLNLTQTVVYDPAGLDLSTTTAGAYGSAYDVARMAGAFYAQHPEYFELTQSSSVSIPVKGHTVGGLATAAPLLSIPGLVGVKTGYTDLAGGNLVAVFDLEIGHPLVAVVLGSTQSGRFDDIRTLINAARSTP